MGKWKELAEPLDDSDAPTMKPTLQAGRKYFVHRYKWSHEDRRKKFLRMFKDGKVNLLQSTRDGWLYQIKEAP